MFSSNKIFSAILFILIICNSCQNKQNKIKIQTIEELEEITLSEINNLKNININEIKNNIKLGNFNILQLEAKGLDSISVELIYFEFRHYLNYINKTTTMMHSINDLKNTLQLNHQQLNKLKLDYTHSRDRRDDLDSHLKNEAILVETTSKKIEKITDLLTELNVEFDSLNKKIELIIYDN